MNTKRAFPCELDDFHGPAKKRSFLRSGSISTHLIPISNEDLNAVKAELKQGLYHIGEALRKADVSMMDMFSIQPLTDARDIIQRFIKTTVGRTPLDELNRFQNSYPSSTGWNPMGSQFPPLGMIAFQEKGVEPGRINGNLFARGSGKRGRFSSSQVWRLSKKAVVKKCNICKVECNSFVQWEQHVGGQNHKARLAGKEPPKRTLSKRNDLSGNVKGYVEKPKKITCDICDLTLLEVDYKQHIAGRKHKRRLIHIGNDKNRDGDLLKLCDFSVTSSVKDRMQLTQNGQSIF